MNMDDTAVAAAHQFEQPVVTSRLGFPVVGIGASAGGLTALTRLFETLPADTGMAFVVVMHLSPAHQSAVDSILQRSTRMPVSQVTGTTPIEADHVYVIPPNRQLTMSDGHLELNELPPRRGRHAAIDLFFRTLAQAHRERAIGIVLSGTGCDGAVGLRSLREYGGVALAQSPHDAEYPGMPECAIATGVVDMVLPADRLAPRLAELWHNASRLELPDVRSALADAGEPPMPTVHESPTASAAEAAQAALGHVMALLRTRTGQDFKHYKRATVLRRLERRMQVTRQPNLVAYRDHFESYPDEAQALLQDLLISVTNFFRDRNAYQSLEAALLQRLNGSLATADGRRTVAEPLRVWVPGCATGEEAYSVAMMLAEIAETVDLGEPPGDFQLFASDIDERAIAVARAGRYPESITVDVPPLRLRRFFHREKNSYVVKKSLRERVLFASQNILQDPPFSRLDLICCRNLLIYLERDIQSNVLDLLHFALNPGGLLFLGSSESIDPSSRLFTAVDRAHRIYQRTPGSRGRRGPVNAVGPATAMVLRPPVGGRAAVDATGRPAADAPVADLHAQLLERYAPASVLLDAAGNIVHLSERAGRFLRYGAGPPTHDLLAAVLPEIRAELRTALFYARRSSLSVEGRRLHLKRDGRDRLLNITARPVRDDASGTPLMLVLFDELDVTLDDATPPAASAGGKDGVVRELESELQRLDERLRDSLGESQTSIEELRASNEELQAINEELRSASEELDVGKEELQSVNEELVTVNQELKSKVEETSKINDDLQNLITSTDMAAVFVDADLRIMRFTPRASEVFNLLSVDIGRSLLDITHRLDYQQLAEDATATFASLRTIEREVHGLNGRSWRLRVMPYRTAEDRIGGAVLTLTDISERRDAEAALQAREEHMRLVSASTKDFAIVTLNLDGRLTSWNAGAERLFGYTEAEVLGQPIDLLFTEDDRARGVPGEEQRVARESGRAEDERWHLRKNGTTLYCSGVMTALRDTDAGPLRGYAKIARDLTTNKLLERRREAVLHAETELRSELQAANAMKDEFLAVLSHELKNPLNLIQINTELLTRLPEVRNLAGVQRATEIIRRTVQSQAKIIDDLLDLSRVNTGKLALSREPMAWLPLVRHIVDAVRDDAVRQQLALTLDAGDDELVVHADTVRVEQIVWNLVSNALKFTPPGGRITVRLTRDDTFARLDVSDTGQGIEPATAAGVFEMFRQVNARATRTQGGLGIGLALVKSLAELHGGRVAVTSDGLGAGSCFSVWLPLSDAAMPANAHPRKPGELAGMRLLVVDDAAETLETFGLLLEMEGAQVTMASSAGDALAKAEQADFDLLMSDVAMPGMDGYQLIGELRKTERHGRLPAIAVTGYGRAQDEERAVKAGFDAHVAKPVSVQALVEVVAQLKLGRGAAGRAAAAAPPATA